MQDSRIKILRDRPPFRIAPTESTFLQPSPPDRPSERGRFRIGDSDTEAGELAQSFAQIYEKIRHFSKLQSAKTPCEALGGQSVFTVSERSGRDVRNRSEREAEAVPRRSGVLRKPTGAGAFREYTRPCVLCKTFSPGRARVPNPPGLRRNEKTTVADRRYSASVSYPSRPAPHISRKTAMPTSAMAIMAM